MDLMHDSHDHRWEDFGHWHTDYTGSCCLPAFCEGQLIIIHSCLTSYGSTKMELPKKNKPPEDSWEERNVMPFWPLLLLPLLSRMKITPNSILSALLLPSAVKPLVILARFSSRPRHIERG